MIKTLTQVLSILTVTGQTLLLLILVAIVTKRFDRILHKIGKKAVLFSLIVASIAMLGSLFFSEIAGYEPCKLCWFQRIFMYPQVLLLIIAIAEKERGVLIYSAALSVMGALISGYHYLLQIGAVPPLSCGTVGYSVSCSEKFVMSLGYVTIPMMALTAFLLIAAFSVIGIYRNRD